MKKIVIYALAVTAMAIAAVSCTQEAYPETTGVEMTFTASHVLDKPEGTDVQETLTRTVLGDNGAVLWSPKDEVSIFKGSGSNGGSKFTSQNSAPAETVEFKGYLEGLGDLSEGECYWAIYPYSSNNSCDGESITAKLPANQTAVKGSFAKGCHPAIARTTGTDLRFYAIAGGLEFTVSRSDIKAIIIKGKNNEALAGAYKATFGTDGKPSIQVISYSQQVTLTAPDGTAFTPEEPYVISLLPTTFSNGVTITLITNDYKEGTVTSSKSQTIKRSVFGVLKDIDLKAKWEEAEPEAVDLGLSVKWATFNVGATKPEEYGDYFAWGETEPKDYYSWSNYKYVDYEILTKYNTNPKYFKKVYNRWRELEFCDDAAHANWGEGWRMPTKEEWEELISFCDWSWHWYDDYAGFEIRSQINGNAIFLPIDLYPCLVGELYGQYWSSSLYEYDSDYRRAWNVILPEHFQDNNRPRLDGKERAEGFPVRPVWVDVIPAQSIEMPQTLEIVVGRLETLPSKVLPENATYKTLIWESSNDSVVTSDEYGNLLAVAVGTAVITVRNEEDTISESCIVTVIEPRMIDGYEYVDLGLSVLWATCNIGANSPEMLGDYFAWGETDTKSYFSWGNYKWCLGTEQTLTKYNFDPFYGIVDNKTVLDLEDDAARANWGGGWRIPTVAEYQELMDNCKWEWVSYKGSFGFLIRSNKTGRSIFFPKATGGLHWGYWTSSLYEGLPYDGCCFCTSMSYYYKFGGPNRCQNQTIRAVIKP